MSNTYHITCHKHKETIWVGQGWGPHDFTLYGGELINKFLFRHIGCDLQFQDDNYLDEIEKIPYGREIEGELLGFPVYVEFKEPEQIIKAEIDNPLQD